MNCPFVGQKCPSQVSCRRASPIPREIDQLGRQSLALVVYGLGNAWLTDVASAVLEWLATQGSFVATVGTGFAVAALASIMNNMPATLVGALAIDGANVPAATRELMIYANVVGNDLGPKLTSIGSLATLLWLHVLGGKGQRITWGQYMKVGLILTPPVLLATLIALWLWLPFAR